MNIEMTVKLNNINHYIIKKKRNTNIIRSMFYKYHISVS